MQKAITWQSHALWKRISEDSTSACLREWEAEEADRRATAKAKGRGRRSRALKVALPVVHSEYERWAVDVRHRVVRLDRVEITLECVAHGLRTCGMSDGSDEPSAWIMGELYLVTHRAKIVTAYDAALRLVAAVWDLGVPERVLNATQAIVENRRVTTELRAALQRIRSITKPYTEERHDILHAGGSPKRRDFDYENERRAALSRGNRSGGRASISRAHPGDQFPH